MLEIRQLLGPDSDEAIDHLESAGQPDETSALPAADELVAALLELAVPHEDIDPLVALVPRSAELTWLLERCAAALVRHMGRIEAPPPFPTIPESLGPISRYFYVYVFLAAAPHVRTYHRSRGVSEEISRRTLRDLGRNMAVYRRAHNVGGLDTIPWLRRHFRGTLYDLGRLQFERARLRPRTGEAISNAGFPYTTGDLHLGIHIPAFSGPLSVESCAAAVDRAREFFPRHFPEEEYRIATCHSWLLDDQLAEYLPAGSNILRFQERFRRAYIPEDADEDAMHFVFGRGNAPLDTLPRDTTLQRAIIDHQRAGRHWHGGAGWFELRPCAGPVSSAF